MKFLRNIALLSFAMLGFFSLVINVQAASLVPEDLRCEFVTQPLGVDVKTPNLSWTLTALNVNARGLRQSAYRILVASSQQRLQENKADLWDSGKIISDQMAQIIYAGKPLASSQEYWWKVQVWDQADLESKWSDNASWVTGILDLHDWQAQWISAKGADKYALNYQSAKNDFRANIVYAEKQPNAPKVGDKNFSSLLLRHEFKVQPNLIRAFIHISGLGQYELSINGSKVGDYLLTPGWTNYKKTVLYDTYDITSQLKAGKNALGIIMGNGMYNIQADPIRYVKFLNSFGQLKAIAQIKLEYADGSSQIVGSDNSWLAAPGPITFSNIFGGEDYDANLVQAGWDSADFIANSSWNNAQIIDGPGGELKGLSAIAAPIKAIENLSPQKVTQLQPGVWVYDLGQNASMMPHIIVTGEKGAIVRIIPAELLKPDGTVDRTSATQDGVRPAWWQYTLSGSGKEEWSPKFFYQGARYLQVELLPARKDGALPVVEKLNGIVVHSSAQAIGSFESSNELFNKIYGLVRWAQRSNMMSLMTDCPHREKLGWLEQYHLNGPSLRYNFDLSSLFKKAMNDMADSQLDNGFIPNIAPEYFIAGSPEVSNSFRNSPEWGSSFIIVPWQQYLFSGDTSLLRKYYEAMKRYHNFLSSTAKNNIIPTGLGDWYDMGPKEPWGSQLTPVSLTATAIYYYDTWILARAAELLGKTEDAKYFDGLAAYIRYDFNNTFFNVQTGQYATGSQTANAMPLALNITEPEHRKSVIDAVIADIHARGNALTSGDVGYRYLLSALAMEHYSDVIYDMNNQSSRPGYGYQLAMGATSLTEKWNAGVGNFGSQNHFMLGQINEWFFRDLVGIGVDIDGAGFRKILIKPEVTGDLTWVKGSYASTSGIISTAWKKENNVFTLDISIPPNALANIFIPAKNQKNVTENGQSTRKVKGIRFIKMENGRAIYEVPSGHYHFVSKNSS